MYFTNITGGEPFIRTDLKDIVRELYKKSDRIVISTNGFFTDRIVDLAKEFPQIGIRISIEGLEDTNNEIRGLENGYQRGYQTLKKLREMGMKDVGFGMTVQDKNAPDLVPLYNISNEMGMEFATASLHNSFYFVEAKNIINDRPMVAKNFENLVNELLKSNSPKKWFRAYFNHGLINYIYGQNRLLPGGIDGLVLHNVRLEFEKKYPNIDFVPVIGDVRVKERVRMVFDLYHPQIVFHAAAYKHVPLMEENPCEAVLVNVTGSRQVADMAVEYGAEKMIMVSTDKAVNPTNVMGCSKRLAEIYVQSLGCAIREGKVKGHTKFITTRFGNVLGSNGSVIPRFKEQIENGGPVTVTHPDIIRFFMTIPEACRLVMEAATMGEGNEIFVFEMGKAVKIVDLATRMIELAGYRPGEDIKIEFTGLRPGEKLYEEVLSDKENTIPTENKKIMIAKVRRYEYADILDTYAEFEKLSRAVKIMDTVRLMKKIVPEFKSKNSPRFEVLDKE